MAQSRYLPFLAFVLAVPAGIALTGVAPFLGGLVTALALTGTGVGVYDILQRRRAVLRN